MLNIYQVFRHNHLKEKRTLLFAQKVSFGLLLLSCTAHSQQQTFKEGVMHIGNNTIQVMIADTLATRQRGLMHVEHLPKDSGMWFQFDDLRHQCMWMKNTPIHLDVAFINRDLKIINIEAMQAHTETRHCSQKPAAFALEMNQGWFKSKHITAGSLIEKPQTPFR